MFVTMTDDDDAVFLEILKFDTHVNGTTERQRVVSRRCIRCLIKFQSRKRPLNLQTP